MNITPEHITRLRLNEVVVFGSNLAGTIRGDFPHRMKRDYGAADGIAEGLSGCCYALPVKDEHLHWLPLTMIGDAVDRFYRHARRHHLWFFSVSRIGGTTPGHFPADIAPLFFEHGMIPENVSLPRLYWDTWNAKVQEVEFTFPIQTRPAQLSV
jgi:hypothetical protein